jgi:hypothetical protein
MSGLGSSSVPLMMDIEGQNVDDRDDHASIKDDFAYNNNVVGASKHIRMGKRIVLTRCDRCFINYLLKVSCERSMDYCLSSLH